MKTEAIRIRRAGPDDAAAVAGLLNELGYPVSADFMRSQLERLGQSPDDYVLVAETGSGVCGLVKLHVMLTLHEERCLGRLTALVVTASGRGRGIGRALVVEAKRIARQRNCSRLEVTSAEHRVDTHEFYRKVGFQETSRRFVLDLSS